MEVRGERAWSPESGVRRQEATRASSFVVRHAVRRRRTECRSSQLPRHADPLRVAPGLRNEILISSAGHLKVAKQHGYRYYLSHSSRTPDPKTQTLFPQ